MRRTTLAAALLAGVSATAIAQRPPQQPPQTPPQQPVQRPEQAQQPQDRTGQDPARSPARILERHTKAIDPQGRLASVQGIRTVSEFTVPGTSQPTKLTVAHARPNSVLIAVEGPNGTAKQGYDGSTGWSSDGDSTRTLSAAESRQLAGADGLQSMGRSMAMFTRAEPAGERQVDGKAADCLRLTWKSGVQSTECYARETGLLVESRTSQAGAQGNVETVTRYYDYQPANGILVARRLVNEVAGQSQEIKVKEVAVGPVDARMFARPGGRP